MINKEYLKSVSNDFGFVLDDTMLLRLDIYADMLVEWNKNINLTAIVEPDEIVIKHFLDSFLMLKATSIKPTSSLIDVGTGAGFPSLPCKIIREDINLTMLDSLNKRINFLNAVVDKTGIKANCVHGRAEECSVKPEFREKFDFATARAVAHLRELTEFCLPYVKVGGKFIALKGYDIEEELEEAKKAIKVLGGEVEEVKKFILPDESKRGIVIIKKISQTSTKYPRTFGKMKKQPII